MTQDEYLAFTAAPVVIGDDTFYARVHWARVGGQVQVVGVDLRAFYSVGEQEATRVALEDGLDFDEPWPRVSTATLRSLRFAEVAEASRRTLLDSLDTAPPPLPADRGSRERTRTLLEPSPDVPRRGPPPMLKTEDLRTVVAPAYLNGGDRPVVAVHEALQGIPAMKGHATKEQARKAVVKARALGFIPPSDRSKR
jgi:hypothetical protein